MNSEGIWGGADHYRWAQDILREQEKQQFQGATLPGSWQEPWKWSLNLFPTCKDGLNVLLGGSGTCTCVNSEGSRGGADPYGWTQGIQMEQEDTLF